MPEQCLQIILASKVLIEPIRLLETNLQEYSQ
jgi:hypothetical protein